MKVAILLYGHMRTYKETIQNNLDYLIKPLNADVFIHTWNDRDMSYGGISFKEENLEETAIKLYNPKKIIVENYDDVYINELIYKIEKYKNKVFGKRARPDRIVSMLYKVNQVFNMVDNIFEYDIIIKSRPDLFFDRKIELSDFNIDNINIPKERDIIPPKAYSNGFLCGYLDNGFISDIFAIAKPQYLKRYMTVYDNLDNLMNVGNYLDSHILVLNQLKMENIKINRIDFNFSILRRNPNN